MSLPTMKYQALDRGSINSLMDEPRTYMDSASSNGHMYRGMSVAESAMEFYRAPWFIGNFLVSAGDESTSLFLNADINLSDSKKLRLLVFTISSKCIIVSSDSSGFVSSVSAPQVLTSNPRE